MFIVDWTSFKGMRAKFKDGLYGHIQVFYVGKKKRKILNSASGLSLNLGINLSSSFFSTFK